MVVLFGGLRFRRMDLFRVKCVRLLLDACTETLETLRLYPSDMCGEEFTKKRGIKRTQRFTADGRALLPVFDLSRNKSLRTLETTSESINMADGRASEFFQAVLSSVTSPGPLDVIVIYWDLDLGGTRYCLGCPLEGGVCFNHASPQTRDRNARRYLEQLEVFRVLCTDVSDCMVEYAIEKLERIVKTGYLLYRPQIISERQTLRTRYTDHSVGWSGKWPMFASAL